MVTATAQLVALACHFNGRARGFRPDSFFPSNSTCKFCEDIHFARRRRGWFGQTEKWTITAQTADDWLCDEARPGRRAIVTCQRVDDPRISDRMSAGFVGGGGRWRLNLVADGRLDVWEAKWEVGNREAPDRRIWQVNYLLVAEDVSFALPEFRSPEAIITALKLTLADLLMFCRQRELDYFAGCFSKASECLLADDPLVVDHRDLIPEELLNLPAKKLLAASQAAWVFGGMGSWNDMGFEGEAQNLYEKLSDDLFTLLNEAICVSANLTAGLEDSR